MQYQFQRRKKPEGYRELLVYRRAAELQDLVYQTTENFPVTERRRREHMRDSARSVKQNIVEGWKRETTQQYIDFLSFSFGSLGELKEDIEDCYKRGLIKPEKFDELTKRCGEIDFLLGRLKSALERKISKAEVLSPYQRWLGRFLERKQREEEEFDKEIERRMAADGYVRLVDGRYVKKEELEKGEKGEKGEGDKKGEGNEWQGGKG